MTKNTDLAIKQGATFAPAYEFNGDTIPDEFTFTEAQLDAYTQAAIDQASCEHLRGDVGSRWCALAETDHIASVSKMVDAAVPEGASDLPVSGIVVLDAEIRNWAKARGMHLFYGIAHWHVKINKTWCTTGYETPQKALEACWESGEYEDLLVCQEAAKAGPGIRRASPTPPASVHPDSDAEKSSDNLAACAGGGVTQPLTEIILATKRNPVDAFPGDKTWQVAPYVVRSVDDAQKIATWLAKSSPGVRFQFKTFAEVANVKSGGCCAEKAKPGGCQLHNLHCGYPKCDQAPRPDAPTSQIKTDVSGYHDPDRLAAWNAANPDHATGAKGGSNV